MLSVMEVQKSGEAARSTPLRDNEATRKLELAALNLVSLGEWEAARAQLTVLASSQPEGRSRAKEILISLVLNARDYW